ncbi:hypothetical protein J3L11_18915, partial [Shewanella sp. 4t3-1-2LB]|uniref:hypothetical protein n=1 Tax=Shewanella sp. 4t3-1-2LB TaxID=2817682 RepID=UPI001A980385
LGKLVKNGGIYNCIFRHNASTIPKQIGHHSEKSWSIFRWKLAIIKLIYLKTYNISKNSWGSIFIRPSSVLSFYSFQQAGAPKKYQYSLKHKK